MRISKDVKLLDDQGRAHADNAPATIVYSYQRKVAEYWCQHGVYHRENGPAVTRYFSNKKPKTERWYLNDICHRTDGPAAIAYYHTGQVRIEEWFQDGVLARKNGPSRKIYFSNGQLEFEEWVVNKDTFHRLNGPAFSRFDKEGNTINKFWEFMGLRHRMDGPASVWYCGKRADCEYYLADEPLPEEEYKERIKNPIPILLKLLEKTGAHYDIATLMKRYDPTLAKSIAGAALIL